MFIHCRVVHIQSESIVSIYLKYTSQSCTYSITLPASETSRIFNLTSMWFMIFNQLIFPQWCQKNRFKAWKKEELYPSIDIRRMREQGNLQQGTQSFWPSRRSSGIAKSISCSFHSQHFLQHNTVLKTAVVTYQWWVTEAAPGPFVHAATEMLIFPCTVRLTWMKWATAA